MSGSTTTWYAVVDGTGRLVSLGTTVASAATLSAAGLSAITLSAAPTPGQVWNPNAKVFAAPPAQPNPSTISVLAFVKRFTPQEYAAMRASTDPQVALFLLEIDFAPGGNLTLTDADVVNGLAYLASVSILTAARQTAIGTP